MSIYDVFSGGNRPFDKEEWAAAKQAQRKEAYELIDNTCSEMMASGDSFRQYLNVQVALTATPWLTLFWCQHRCPKQRSLKSTANGKRTVSM